MIHTGELAALGTAFCWTFTSLFFEAASKRLGTLNVNVIRLLMALVIFTAYCFVTTGHLLPQAEPWRVGYLAVSGFIGFFIGDLFLFEAFKRIGAKTSMLMMALAPVLAALLGFVFLDETLNLNDILAITITIGGIAFVILVGEGPAADRRKMPLSGIVFAGIGALSQAGGIIFSRKGIDNFDPVLATDIRVITGTIAFVLAVLLTGRLRSLLECRKDWRGLAYSGAGAVLGPFLGVSLSLYSIKTTPVAVTSVLMALAPVLLVPVTVLLKKDIFRPLETIGIVTAVGGVALLFLF